MDISYIGLRWLGASNDRVDPLCSLQLTAQVVREKVGGRLYGLMSWANILCAVRSW